MDHRAGIRIKVRDPYRPVEVLAAGSADQNRWA